MTDKHEQNQTQGSHPGAIDRPQQQQQTAPAGKQPEKAKDKDKLDEELRSEADTFRSERSPADIESDEADKATSDSLSPNKQNPGWISRNS